MCLNNLIVVIQGLSGLVVLALDRVLHHDHGERIVYVPFFIIQWSDNKDKYNYFNIDMKNFLQWLRKSFEEYCNVPYEIGELFKDFSNEIHRQDYSKVIINLNELNAGVSQMRKQFPLEQKQDSHLIKIDTDNDQKNLVSIKKPAEFFATPTQVLPPAAAPEVIPDECLSSKP
jgi:hypothetical protein